MIVHPPYFCAVYSTFDLAKKYFSYYFHASNSKGHGMHSPFVFDFILNVLNNENHYEAPEEVESLRRKFLSDRTRLKQVDLGAGSRSGLSHEKTVSEIARTSLKNKKYARLLYRLTRHYQPSEIIELGTSLGVTTAYLSLANNGARVSTIEGNPYIREKAMKGFQWLGIKNIESLEGDFARVLPGLLSKKNKIDLAYIDGNHKKEPTLDYFEEILKKTHDHSILVFDDIHWSREMEEAWEEIKRHPEVQYTIDIFFLGFVFFRKEFKVKQHFSIRF
jgi:predicted O-methyltransferase YrrM